jgi:hypothetical protein
MKPVRVQRSRAKGWKTPANTIYVGRPGPFGNPFKVGGCYKRVTIAGFDTYATQIGSNVDGYTRIATNDQAVDWFRWLALSNGSLLPERAVKELRGKNLMCWCPLHQPCHADVLLELANQ